MNAGVTRDSLPPPVKRRATRESRIKTSKEKGRRSAREGRCLLEMVIIKSRRVGAHTDAG